MLIYVFCIANQTAGPNWRTFFKGLNHGLNKVEFFKIPRVTLDTPAKIMIQDQARVNGGIKYELPGQR